MLQKNTTSEISAPLKLTSSEITKCNWITFYFIIQCIVVFVGALSIQLCVWSPEHSTRDYDKLARIMYLYDPTACGYNLRTSSGVINIQLSNDTRGLNVLPIKWTPVVATVTTRLAAKTRRYINTSVFMHSVWLSSAVALFIFKSVKSSRILKIIFAVFFYVTFCVLFYDVSMAMVNITHIQQSLTTNMILRYSGWSVEMKISNHDDFGGWWPIAASICWMRGIVFFCLNIYCCAVIWKIRRRLLKTEVKRRFMLYENMPIPDPDLRKPIEKNVLYYKKGENRPYY